jgi:hypothetical protein
MRTNAQFAKVIIEEQIFLYAHVNQVFLSKEYLIALVKIYIIHTYIYFFFFFFFFTFKFINIKKKKKNFIILMKIN